MGGSVAPAKPAARDNIPVETAMGGKSARVGTNRGRAAEPQENRDPQRAPEGRELPPHADTDRPNRFSGIPKQGQGTGLPLPRVPVRAGQGNGETYHCPLPPVHKGEGQSQEPGNRSSRR